MVYALLQRLTGFLAGTEIVTVDNGGVQALGVTSAQLAAVPAVPGSSATGSVGASGNLNVQVSPAGVNPGGTAAAYVIALLTIPPSAFDAAGRSVSISAIGGFGATGNNKRISLVVGATAPVVGSIVSGGTTIADTGTVATNGGGWSIKAEITKYGAAGSNTQMVTQSQIQAGVANVVLAVPALLTQVESAAITVAVVGNATTAATDIVFNSLQAFWKN